MSSVNEKQPSTKFAAGSVWMVGWRWAQRSLGLISVAILARLLTPEDFGVVAMATIVVGLMEVLADAGVKSALVQRKEIDRTYLDTGWTMRFVQRLVIALSLLPAAQLGAIYFEDQRLVPVVYWLAISVFLIGCENIGVVYFQRELNFKKEFWFGLLQKIIGFIVTLVCAFALKNYWALVIGVVASQTAGVILSYVMHPYRPKFSLVRFNELWLFSKWLLVSGITRYVRVKIDQIVVGGVLGSKVMGQYAVAFEVATLPTTEVVVPVTRALFPNYSRLVDRIDLMQDAFLKALGATMILVMAIGIGMASVADSLVPFLLGDKWLMVIPLLQWLAILGVLTSMSFLVWPILAALGKTNVVAWLEIVQTGILIPIVAFAAQTGDVVIVAQSRVAAMIIILPISYAFLIKSLKLRVCDIATAIARPLVAGIVMGFVVMYYSKQMSLDPALELAVLIPVGALLYVSIIISLAFVSGYRGTLEYDLFLLARRKMINK